MEKNETEESTEETEVVETKETKDDSTDWETKAKELEKTNKDLESRAIRSEKKLGKLKSNLEDKPEKEEPKSTPEKESSKLDYGQLAFHNSLPDVVKIRKEDREFLKEQIEKSGKTQEEVLESKWFFEDLKVKQDAQSVKEATPSTTKRSTGTSKGKVDYWLNKPFGDVPDDMKQEVLNKQLEVQKQGSKFSKNPVVQG